MSKMTINETGSGEKEQDKEQEIAKEKGKGNIMATFDKQKVHHVNKNVHLVNKAVQCWVKKEGEEKQIVKSELDKTLNKYLFRTIQSDSV